MPTKIAAGLYLLAFGAGTIIAMAIFSLIFGAIGAKLAFSNTKYFKYAMATSACAAIAVGGYWLA
jgi:sulfite exporter TauE/SafE